jgi:hypothetical protein
MDRSKPMGRPDYSGRDGTQEEKRSTSFRARQSRSITPAIAIPKPMHIVAMP